MYTKLKLGQKVFFKNEILPYQLKSIDDRYAIVVRKIHRRHDAGLMHHEVKMGAFCTFTEAFNHFKDAPVYSILDFKLEKRAPNNLVFSDYDYWKQEDIDKCMIDLHSGEVELSQRNGYDLEINWDKTENN